MKMIKKDRYLEIIGNAEMQALSGIWSQLIFDTKFFKIRQNIFLWILECLLKEGRIKLHKKGVFIEASIEEQIEMFKKAWPASIKASGYEDFYWWFFDDDCPAGVAWRDDKGQYIIAD